MTFDLSKLLYNAHYTALPLIVQMTELFKKRKFPIKVGQYYPFFPYAQDCL